MKRIRNLGRFQKVILIVMGVMILGFAAAYAAFANNGVYNEPKTYVKVLANDNTTVILEKETEQHVAMKETTAYLAEQLEKLGIRRRQDLKRFMLQ